mgnify:CR=1 FL=1
MIHSPKHHTELPPAYTTKEMQDMLNKWERVRLLTLKLMNKSGLREEKQSAFHINLLFFLSLLPWIAIFITYLIMK